MERRPERSERSDGPRSETIVDARVSLALWLRAGRAQRRMSLDDVAKVTKIQPRILERLEAGKLEGLPADVFVRGFVRSFARCVGLDEEEALRRYAACGPGGSSGPGADNPGNPTYLGNLGNTKATGSSSPDITPAARALVEAMGELVPGTASAARATPRRMVAVEVVDLAAGSLAAGGLRALPANGAIVETVMLPETGTVVMPARLPASLAEAMTDSDSFAEAEMSTPVVDPGVAGSAVAVAVEPAAVIRVDSGSVESAHVAPATQLATQSFNQPVNQSLNQPVNQSLKKKRGRRGKGRNKRTTGGGAPAFSRELLAVGTPAEASPVVVASMAPALEVSEAREVTGAPEAPDMATARGSAVMTAALVGNEPNVSSSAEPSASEPSASGDEPIATATWAPKMPPIASTPSVPWRRPAYMGTSAAPVAVVVPSLVIDDADPESAERILEERAEKHAPRRSFLPPILLDREDRSARQGGLTLAVIILLIAATLTLSYLMRRPSAGGDGMTRLDTPAGQRTQQAQRT